jgi:KaiC/GvpD/RAD55 family RecA-like ATPase
MATKVLLHPSSGKSDLTETHIPCEACGSSDAKCVYSDGHGYCFSCNTYFKPNNSDRNNDLNETYYEYLPWRNIDKATMAFYDAKTQIAGDGKPLALEFKYPNDSYKIRAFAEKAFYSKGDINKAGLFGRNKFPAGSNTTVTITEGELDALSLYQVTRTPTVSVRSSSSAVLDCTLDRSWLNSFDRIIIAFDGDGPGRDAVAGVAKLFDFNKVQVVKFPGGNRKDANDFLQAGERSELITLWKNAKRYLPDTVVSDFESFEKILRETPQKGIPYPWPTLNFMTYGIRPGESVLITAPEGVGKTEVCHAIEYQLLTNTDWPVAAIYIEEPKKRHLQALAGLKLRTPVHLPDCAVDDSRILTAVQEVIGQDDRLHLYSHFGSDDPDSILDTIRFCVVARGCRAVILDHITMVVSGLGGSEATQALDYLSTRLEMMVKELNFALIFVSHVNDDGLTRGSRNISKIADIRLDLSRDVTSVDPVVRCTTTLIVSKNRFCGRTGPAGELLFDPVSYTLSEFGVAANDNIPSDEYASRVA